MKEVEQTRIGMEGNCFAACVASILELPIEAVPDYTEQAGGWFYRWQVWLVERGLRFRIIPANQGGAIGYEPPAGWAIMNVKSLTLPGELHSVVSWNGQMKWNPHPQREKGVGEVVDYYIFEALDPSKLLQPIAVLSAPPIEPVVEEVVEVSQLGFCSARLRDMGLTSSDRIRVVGWTTEAQGGV